MNKYETITNINNYRNNYNYNEEITKNLDNLETNIYKRYNNPSMSYFEIKNIIRNEFSELILPYQKQLNNYDNVIEKRINNAESNLKGIIDSKMITYEECRSIIDNLKYNKTSQIFGKEREEIFKGILGNIYQSFGGQDIYETIQEKGANLLYLSLLFFKDILIIFKLIDLYFFLFNKKKYKYKI